MASLDVRLTTVIMEGLEMDQYLEVFVHEGEVVHAFIKNNWLSTLTLGWNPWFTENDPYVEVRGKNTSENKQLIEDLKQYCKIDYKVVDHLF